MNKIEINELNKVINNVTILNNINITFEKGKIYGLYGHNGSGKTMLLRALCGLIKISSGSIRIFNEELHKDIDFPRSIGVLIESPNFWSNYTGKEALKTLADIKSIINDNEIEQALKDVGLDINDNKIIKKYSLGMKQRLGIAQAIMEKPNIILLDEPTSALDEDGIILVHNLLKRERERGAIILISSHNKYDIEELSDYKLKMNNGNLIKM